MITYQNTSGTDLYLDDEHGSKIYLKPSETFSGSAYFRRLTTGELKVLTVLVDDYSSWVDGADYIDAGRTPYATRLTITAGSDYDTTGNSIIFTETTIFGGPAVTLQVKNSTSGQTVTMRINESSNAVVTIDAGESISFDYKELLITTIEFANSNLSNSTVDIIATGT